MRLLYTETPVGHSNPEITVTQTDNIFTTTPASASTSATPSIPIASSLVCPTANGSTYDATNKPSSILSPEWVIPNTYLTYQILCNTNFRSNDGSNDGFAAAVDLQIINSVTSLQDCLDACALYSFQTMPHNFPVFGCRGLVWNSTVSGCWLMRNLTLSESDTETGLHAAILLST